MILIFHSFKFCFAYEFSYKENLYNFEYKFATNNTKLTVNELLEGSYIYYKLNHVDQSLTTLDKIKINQTWPNAYLELYTLNFIKQNRINEAKIYWENSTSNNQLPWFELEEIDYSKEPAIYLAYILPGSGLIYEKQYKSGIIALLINGILIYGILDSFLDKNYYLSFVLLFFELPFYNGSIDVTKNLVSQRIAAKNKHIKDIWEKKAQKILEIRFQF